MPYTFEDAMSSPGDVFDRPLDVLVSSFDKTEQWAILASWADQMHKRQLATTEGMPPGTACDPGQLLAAIADAERRLACRAPIPLTTGG